MLAEFEWGYPSSLEEQLIWESFAQTFADSLAKGQTVACLRLRSDSPTHPKDKVLIEVPAGYLPRAFVVEDAGITNAPVIRLFKHFYF